MHIKPQHDNGRGYMTVDLWKNNKSKREYVHRLVALTFIPNPDNKPQVDHIDTDRANNEVSNLKWVTNSENMHNHITNQRNRAYKRVGVPGKRNGAYTHPERNSFINNNPSYKGMKAHNTGMHWFNNGVINKQAYECPEGFIKGRL